MGTRFFRCGVQILQFSSDPSVPKTPFFVFAHQISLKPLFCSVSGRFGAMLEMAPKMPKPLVTESVTKCCLWWPFLGLLFSQWPHVACYRATISVIPPYPALWGFGRLNMKGLGAIPFPPACALEVRYPR